MAPELRLRVRHKSDSDERMARRKNKKRSKRQQRQIVAPKKPAERDEIPMEIEPSGQSEGISGDDSAASTAAAEVNAAAAEVDADAAAAEVRRNFDDGSSPSAAGSSEPAPALAAVPAPGATVAKQSPIRLPPPIVRSSNTHFVHSDCSLLHGELDANSANPVPPGVTAAGRQPTANVSATDTSIMQPMTCDELTDLLVNVENLSPDQREGTLLRVLESIIHEVMLDNDTFQEIYSFLIGYISISTKRVCTSAYVALMRCQSRGHATKIIKALLTSLTRSARCALIEPMRHEDLQLLAKSELEPDVQELLNKFIVECQLLPVRREYKKPLDVNKAIVGVEASGYGFSNIADMLTNIDRGTVNHPGRAKQVRIMLASIFSRHKQYLETHARAVTLASQAVSYCPPAALPVILEMLRSSVSLKLSTTTSKCHLAMASQLIPNLDIKKAKTEELVEVVTLLGDACGLSRSTWKDVLASFQGLHERLCAHDSDLREPVTKSILDEAMLLVERGTDYMNLLQLADFFGALQMRGETVPMKVFETLINKATGVSLINRVCGILLRMEESDDDNGEPNRKLIILVRHQVQQWYSQGETRSEKIRKREVLKIEQPNIYNYIYRK